MDFNFRKRSLVMLIATILGVNRINSEVLVFPQDDTANPIPERVFVRLANVSNADQLIRSFDFFIPGEFTLRSPAEGDDDHSEVLNDTTETTPFSVISGRKKPSMTVLSTGIAAPASCKTELQTVMLRRSNDPTMLVWPECTRVERCSGCCTSRLMECVPTETSTVEVMVLKARYKANSRSRDGFDFEGRETVKLEKHEKCACQCIQKAEDCTSRQVYKADECRCECTNNHEASSCTGPNYIWDASDCRCKCRDC